jgi:hypothetical protein
MCFENRPADLAEADCQFSPAAPILAAVLPTLKKHIVRRKWGPSFSRARR